MTSPPEINLWKRANLEQANPDTRQLIIEDEQPQYDAVLAEVEAAGVALNSLLGLIPAAQERMSLARQAQIDYFRGQQTRGTV